MAFSRDTWTFAIRQVAHAQRLVIEGDILIDMDTDGFRVRVRFDDDPPLRWDERLQKTVGFKVVLIPIKEFSGRSYDAEAFIEHIGSCFDKIIAERKAEREETARIERETAARAQWSPYQERK